MDAAKPRRRRVDEDGGGGWMNSNNNNKPKAGTMSFETEDDPKEAPVK